MLKHRMITATILLPLLLAVIWYFPPRVFAWFVALVVAMAAWEWAGLAGLTRIAARLGYVALILLGIYLSYWLSVFPLLMISFLAWIWITAAIICYNQNREPLGLQYRMGRFLTGFLVLVPGWYAIVLLQSSDKFGPGWLIFGLCITWASDIGGYFIGRQWGKKQLISRVSPQKTWIGLIGGFAFAIIVATIGGLFFHVNLRQHIYLWFLAIGVAFFAVVGDLSVSLLKRIQGVKDTGALLPGHGGLLDRMDSISAAIVVFAFGLVLLGF